MEEMERRLNEGGREEQNERKERKTEELVDERTQDKIAERWEGIKKDG